MDEKFWKKLEELLDRKLEEKLEEKLEKKLKEKLKNFATKDDIKKITKRLDKTATKEYVDKYFERASKVFVYRHEYDERLRNIEENMLTRKEFLDYMERYEDLLQEIRDSRNGRLLTEKHVSDMDDTIASHEKRIRILETHQ